LFTSAALADPKVLSDDQMDRITAGTSGGDTPAEVATGGTLTANQSDTSLVTDAAVNAGENSQVGARAINLVNAADGLSASGVNLWNGATTNLAVETSTDVLQSNELSQMAAPKFANLPGYYREKGSLRDVHTWADSTAPVQKIDFGLELDIPGIGSFQAGAEVPVSVIPGAKIPGAFGNSVGFAGEFGLDFDGGWFEAGFDLAASVNAEAHLDAESSSSLFWGLIDLGGSEIKSDTTIGGSFNPYISIAWELPDVVLNGEGAVCFANGGECSSSILDRDFADLRIRSIVAEHIVIDRSSLDAQTNYQVDLGAEAQASARAVNLVNMAGGYVANGANIATTSDMGFFSDLDELGPGTLLSTDQLVLQQTNVVNQTVAASGGGDPRFADKRVSRMSAVPGGAVVANESEAVLANNRSVSAANGAQAGARAVSLVNSADALVASGVNIWDGRIQEGMIADRTDLMQSNELTQSDNPTAATLSAYERDSESIHSASTYTKSTITPKSLGTTFDLQIINPTPGGAPATMTGSLDVPASIIPTSKIPGIGGMAAAFAGNVDVAIDGGNADFGLGVVESGLHYSTNNSVEGGIGANLGLIEFNGKGHLNYEADATINASLGLVVDMPDLELTLDGAACFAQKGSCEASVMDREVGEIDVAHVGAEYIVLDRSGISVSEIDSVRLDSGAQSGVRAVSLVNAANGSVANGINLASWRGEEALLAMPTLNLMQQNYVVQQPDRNSGAPAYGGVVAANESTADMLNSGSVELMNGSQSGVRALSVVNSAAATVGNGLNIWTGNLTAASFGESMNLQQSNVIMQQSSQLTALLRDYDRDAESSRLVHTSATTKVDDGQPEGDLFPAGRPGQIYGESSLRVGDIVTLDRTGQVPTNIIPTSKIPGGKPGALAVAGQGHLHIDGGQVNLDSTTGSLFTNATDAAAAGSATAFFGIVGGSTNSSYTENFEAGLTTELVIGVDLPDLTLDVDGAICISKGADCSAGTTELKLGALHVGNAAAEYIVIDRSRLSMIDDFSVVLGDSAQAEARALLMTNAAGGHVANGLNISRMVAVDLATQPNTVQSNVVVQGANRDQFGDQFKKLERPQSTTAGGTIVASDSTAALSNSAIVELGSFAQSGAYSIAMVNAADALVGNGINVWDGNIEQADFFGATNIQQTNQVLQTLAPSVARIEGYHRDDSTLRDVYVDADSRAKQQFIKAAFEVDLLELGSYYEGLSVPASAIPNSKIPGTKGIVAGLAGDVDVSFGGGSAHFLFGIDGHLSYDNLAKTNAAGGDFLGFGNAEGSIEFGIDDISVNFAPTLTFDAEFATLNIEAEGALCWANGGTCSAGILEEHRGELHICDAEAEHLVVDSSTLDVSETYSVTLGASAQANARAMAIVNAAGGMVANSINISSFNGNALSSPAINLVQRNVVTQGH
jgi:hypothetical protein